MELVKRWGTVRHGDRRRCQCVCLDTGSTSEKKSPVKRERSGSRDSASSGRSSKASGKSRGRAHAGLFGDFGRGWREPGFSLELGSGGDLEELAFWAGLGDRRSWAGPGARRPLSWTPWASPQRGPVWVVAEAMPSGSRFG